MTATKPSQLPAYLRIASTFSIRQGWRSREYRGGVVASHDAFFIFPKDLGFAPEFGLVQPLLGNPVTAVVGGLLMLGKAAVDVANGPRESSLPRVYPCSSLPQSVVSDPEWPRQFGRAGSFIYLPYVDVTGYHNSFWTTFDVEVDDTWYCFCLPILRRRRVLRYLRQVAWEF